MCCIFRVAGEEKPRSYRQKTRKSYLSATKQRRLKARKRRKAVGKQLGFVERNLNIDSKLKEASSVTLLTKLEYKPLFVISEMCRQQRTMYDQRSRRIDTGL